MKYKVCTEYCGTTIELEEFDDLVKARLFMRVYKDNEDNPYSSEHIWIEKEHEAGEEEEAIPF